MSEIDWRLLNNFKFKTELYIFYITNLHLVDEQSSLVNRMQHTDRANYLFVRSMNVCSPKLVTSHIYEKK